MARTEEERRSAWLSLFNRFLALFNADALNGAFIGISNGGDPINILLGCVHPTTDEEINYEAMTNEEILALGVSNEAWNDLIKERNGLNTSLEDILQLRKDAEELFDLDEAENPDSDEDYEEDPDDEDEQD